MTIGKLAKAAGVGVETVRFYERKGLVRKPPKAGYGYRIYDLEAASRIRFIRRAQELGFTLRETKDLLELQTKRKVTGAEIKQKAEQKVVEIRRKIADLKQMEASLAFLASVCGTGEQAIRECRVFECFEKGC